MSDLRELLAAINDGLKVIDGRLTQIERRLAEVDSGIAGIQVALGTFHSDVQDAANVNAEQHQRLSERVKKLENLAPIRVNI